ncbi:hypothetical protein ACFSQ7_08680 [Paenibacillus rhizoplanae]
MNIDNMAGSMVPGDYKLSAANLDSDEQLDLLNEKILKQVSDIPGIEKNNDRNVCCLDL